MHLCIIVNVDPASQNIEKNSLFIPNKAETSPYENLLKAYLYENQRGPYRTSIKRSKIVQFVYLL